MNTLDSDTDKTVSEIYTVKDEDIITVNELVYEKNETITVEAKDNMIGIKDTITEGEINTSSVASDRVGIRRKYQKRWIIFCFFSISQSAFRKAVIQKYLL